MRLFKLSLLTLLLLVAVGQAQITITSTQVPHTIGNQFRYYGLPAGDSMLVNIGQPSGNQVWNFTGGDTSTVNTDLYLNPALSPPEYSRANVVIQTDALNLFGMGEPGNLYCWLGAPRFILGAATTSYSGTPVGMMFTPYITQYPLPLMMGRTWSNQVNVDQIYNISGTDYRIELHSTLNSSVDAWGTAQVPLGNYEALRLRTNVTYDLTIYIRILFIWIPVAQQSGSSVNYEWRAQNVGLIAGLTTATGAQGEVWTSSLRRLMSSNVTDVLAGVSGGTSVPACQSNTGRDAGTTVLMPNYPNPFNAQTTVSFDLQAASHVSLQVFDVMGRQVAQLADGWQEAGSHEITWAPLNLAAGAYFVQLRAGTQVAQQMMLYLK